MRIPCAEATWFGVGPLLAVLVAGAAETDAFRVGSRRGNPAPDFHGPSICRTPSAPVRMTPAWLAPIRMAPEVVPLQPTRSAPGGVGSMTLFMSESPYGVSVEADGSYAYEVTIEVARLRRLPGYSYVVWAATPELDGVARLGSLDEGGRVTGRVVWNKFLVFVSREASPDVDTWAGPILLTGLSPSGRMHTMAGHGPFEDADCQYF